MGIPDDQVIDKIAKLKETVFGKELVAVESWFSCLSDSEKVASLYTLLQNVSSADKPFLTRQLNIERHDIHSALPTGSDYDHFAHLASHSTGNKHMDALISEEDMFSNPMIQRSQTPAIAAADWGLGLSSTAWQDDQPLINSLFNTTISTSPPQRRTQSPAPGLYQPLRPQSSQRSPIIPHQNLYNLSATAKPFVPLAQTPPPIQTQYQMQPIQQQQHTQNYRPHTQTRSMDSQVGYGQQAQGYGQQGQGAFRAYHYSPQSSPLSTKPAVSLIQSQVSSPNYPSLQRSYSPNPQTQTLASQSQSTGHQNQQQQSYKLSPPQRTSSPQQHNQLLKPPGQTYSTGNTYQQPRAISRTGSPWQTDVSRLKQNAGNASDYSESESDYDDSRMSHKEKGKIPEVVDATVLKDVPAWFRSLRLHKYTSLFLGLKYEQIIVMEDEDLLKRGVNALGARRKMLKVFEMVREYVNEYGYV